MSSTQTHVVSSAPPWSRQAARRQPPLTTAPGKSARATTENFFSSERPPDALQRFAMLPLRLFLGITFAYAGLQKIADPGYLDPSSGTYLGNQLQAFASSSPIGFLIGWLAVPNVQLLGQAVIGVELGVGLLVLAGVFTRFAAIVGALLSFVLFLSATWDVQPYFLGSDTIYAVAWTTMVLVGDGGIFSLQALLRNRFRTRRRVAQTATQIERNLERRTFLLRAGGGLVGLVWLLAILPKSQDTLAAPAADSPDPASSPSPANPFRAQSSLGAGDASVASATPTASTTSTPPATSTPARAIGTPVPPVGAAALNSQNGAAAGSRSAAAPSAARRPSAPTATATPPASPAATKAVPSPAPVPSGPVIATLAQLQQSGGALSFADRLHGGPGIIVDLGGGNVAAYSAVCTHAGCTVEYAARQRLLGCPCHGAIFDPAHGARVLRGPARRPLPAVPVTVAADGAIHLRS